MSKVITINAKTIPVRRLTRMTFRHHPKRESIRLIGESQNGAKALLPIIRRLPDTAILNVENWIR